MCTSLALPAPDGRQLFGRTLDLDVHFGERVTLTPRRYPLTFRDAPPLTEHHALLGMAAVVDGYPLYAEAMNERGLCMAGLRFAGNARYAPKPIDGAVNLPPWELIPYLLGTCATVNEAREALRQVRVVNRSFRTDLPAAPLHWHIADGDPAHGSLVLEVTADGLHLYDNPVGVLTNNPPFPYQLVHYASFSHLTNGRPAGDASACADDAPHSLGVDVSSLGTGAVGLPGDYSSPSRFVRAACLRRWVAKWMASEATGKAGGEGVEVTPVAQFFRIMAAVSPMAGSVLTDRGGCHRTLYTCCMDGAAGVYHYFTEEDMAVRSVGLTGMNLDGDAMTCP